MKFLSFFFSLPFPPFFSFFSRAPCISRVQVQVRDRVSFARCLRENLKISLNFEVYTPSCGEESYTLTRLQFRRPRHHTPRAYINTNVYTSSLYSLLYILLYKFPITPLRITITCNYCSEFHLDRLTEFFSWNKQDNEFCHPVKIHGKCRNDIFLDKIRLSKFFNENVWK